VIWGEGKTTRQIVSIMKQLKGKDQNVLITRLEWKKAAAIQSVFPKSRYYPRSKVLTYLTQPVKPGGKGTILVITAGQQISLWPRRRRSQPNSWETEWKPSTMWVSRESTVACRTQEIGDSPGPHRSSRHGRGVTQCRGRVGGSAGHRRADQHRVRNQFRGSHGTSGDAQLMRFRSGGR